MTLFRSIYVGFVVYKTFNRSSPLYKFIFLRTIHNFLR